MPTLFKTLTNGAYGFPTRGAKRRIKPTVLAVVHITGNAKNLGLLAAVGERNYANRTGSLGPSAHTYLGRSADATTIDAISPASYAAWSNGDFNAPNRLNAGVARLLALKAKGYNGNEGVYWEVECVGSPVVAEVTPYQIEFLAGRLARYSIASGIAISRTTVLLHADINSIDRARCPFAASVREARLAALIKRANVIKAGLLKPVVVTPPSVVVPPPPPPPVVPAGPTIPELQAKVALLDTQLKAATAELTLRDMANANLNKRIDQAHALASQIAQL